ncbi:uncharacterized protein LOC144859643 [Branchiostoma floridae x Branchiostoma japonicum]
MPRFDAARVARHFEGRPAEIQFPTQNPQAAVHRRTLGMIPGERAEIKVHSSGCTILLRHSWRKLWARVGKPPKWTQRDIWADQRKQQNRDLSKLFTRDKAADTETTDQL